MTGTQSSACRVDPARHGAAQPDVTASLISTDRRRSCWTVGMRVENEGLIAVVSFYLYGFVGLSLLVLISPLIVLVVPLLVVLGPLAFAWRRGRRRSPRLG